MIRLAIGIPVYNDPKSKFMFAAMQALNYLHNCNMVGPDGEPVEVECEIIMVSGSALTESRTRILGESLVWGATHLLWLDADHVFPADTFARLLAHNLEIVGTNYARRNNPTAPVAAKHIDAEDDNRNLVYTTPEKVEAKLLEEVDHTGFGVLLMAMSVVDKLQAQADADGEKSFLPLFEFRSHPDGGGLIGEDAFFFEKCRNAGCKVFIDHALSWDVGHIHEQILTNAHANAQQERWAEKTGRIARKFAEKAEELEAQ